MTTTFNRWLHEQVDRDDPIGDLSRDVRTDRAWPHLNTNISLRDAWAHLSTHGASRPALAALVEAYRAWHETGGRYRNPSMAPGQGPRPATRPAIPLRLRFQVLRRDGYQCQLCGRTARDGVKLEIDHRVARSKGGSDAITNLWTLCFDCNRGKSDDEL